MVVDIEVWALRAVVVLAYFALACYLLLLGRGCLRWLAKVRATPVLAMVRALAYASAARVHELCHVFRPRAGTVCDPLQAKVQELCCTRRLQRLRYFTLVLTPVLGAYLAESLRWMHSEGIWGSAVGANMRSLLQRGYALPACVIFTACVLFKAYPAQLTCRKLEAVYAFTIARIAWQTFAELSALAIMGQMPLITGVRFVFSVVIGNPGLVAVLNCVYCGVNIFAFIGLARGDRHLEEAFDDFARSPAAYIVVSETFVTTLTIVACYAKDVWVTAEARATVEAKASRSTERTTRSLLSALCDAVASLDSALRFSAPAPQLATLLLKQPAVFGFKGYSFEELLDAADRPRFQQLMDTMRAAGQTSVAESLHVRMPDGGGTRVSMQLFVTSFLDLQDSQGFAVGVRELEEFRDTEEALTEGRFPEASRDQAAAVDALSHAARPPISAPDVDRLPQATVIGASLFVQRPPEPPDMDQASVFGAPSRASSPLAVPESAQDSSREPSRIDQSSQRSRSSGSGSELMPIDGPAEGQPGEMTVWFNVMSIDLTILRCTAAFTAISGPSPAGAGLVNWLRDGDRFRSFVQLQTNAVSNGELESAVNAGEIRLRPPAAQAGGLEYVAECNLCLPSLQAGAGGAPAEASATFTNLRCRRRHGQRAERARGTPPREPPAQQRSGQ
uniref:PAS domain-containing protein n=1 Tax=Pyrodinium bahamense TaxID=73915 RepID=A0A7S0AS89_9DINO|mmetsp:Transcript_40662/g.112939  ORF Transcript_40662/g.112939 Transcript_40662/m.112939 type:complete len:675 (+) Transcript_40662:132-2156(+)